VFRELREFRVLVVQQVHKAVLELRVFKEHKVFKEQLELRVQVSLLLHLRKLILLVLILPLVRKVRSEPLIILLRTIHPMSV